jgi:hypothetical protein
MKILVRTVLETDADPLGAVNKAGDAAVSAVSRWRERSRDAIRRGTPRKLSEVLEKRCRTDPSLA